jgi:hypothetical protein
MKYVLLIFPIFLLSCKPRESNYYQNFVDKVIDFQKSHPLDISNDSDIIKNSKLFNFQDYFKLFDLLTTDTNWRLDYWYNYYGLGGHPIIVALYDTFDIKYYKDPESGHLLIKQDGPWCYEKKYIEKIQIKKQEKNSYFQLLCLYLIGNKFSVNWHSHYRDLSLICSKEAMTELLNIDDEFHKLSKDFKDKARKLNTTPIIKENEYTYQITILTFTSWVGLSAETYEITKKRPYEIFFVDKTVLLEYDCLIQF